MSKKLTNDHEGIEEEYELAKRLKNDYCTEPVGKQFKETNPGEAAKIIHKIGLIYRKRLDKISLIQSIGLLNAAKLRNPSNLSEIESDLSEIFQFVLKQAQAKQQTANLNTIAEKVKKSLNKLRHEVELFFDDSNTDLAKISEITGDVNMQTLQTNKIRAIKNINHFVADKYIKLMANVSQYCQDILGVPPCKYAIVGMGSLAREEITPYSDFEHVVLLSDQANYESHLNYFRWFTTIFHIIVLNINETIIPSLHIPCLNSNKDLGDWFCDAHTPRGLSFDGMMPHACKFPLGRHQHTEKKPWTTELIKTVKDMLKYLSSESDLRQGYHLADILTKTCFVFGDETLYRQFQTGTQNYLASKSKEARISEIKEQVNEDLNNFGTRRSLVNLKETNSINIKRIVYRSTTLFIAVLARIHNITENSCFNIIDELKAMKQITNKTAHKLQFAIAIACEIRLRVYMQNKSQCDNAIDLKSGNGGCEQLLNIVGYPSTVSYFQIAYCLQCEVATLLKCSRRHFYSNPKLLNIRIGIAFELSNSKILGLSTNQLKFLREQSFTKFNFDEYFEQLQKYSEYASAAIEINLDYMEFIAKNQYKTQNYDEALEFYELLLRNYEIQDDGKEFTDREENLIKIATIKDDIGRCLFEQKHYDLALDAFKESRAGLLSNSQIFWNTQFKSTSDRHRLLAGTLNNIGNCRMFLNQHSDAVNDLKTSLDIFQTTSLNALEDVKVAITLNNLGVCLMESYQFGPALNHFTSSLDIFERTSQNIKTDRNVADVSNNIGLCFIEINQFKEALNYLNRSLHIYQETSQSVKKDIALAKVHNNLGLCLHNLNKHEKCRHHLELSLKIKEERSFDKEKDVDVANANDNISIFFMETESYNAAIEYSQKALRIYERLPAEIATSEIAQARARIDQCKSMLPK